MRIFFFVSTLLFCFYAHAQLNVDSLRQQYNQKTMYLNGRGIVMNGMLLGKTETQNFMLLSPEATMSYQLYLRNSRAGVILPVIGLAATISGLVIAKDNGSTGSILVLSGSVINAVAALFRKTGNNHLQRAVWFYNRDVLYQQH